MKAKTRGKQTDEDLIRDARGGDRAAFTTLVRRYEDTVYGFAFKVCRDREKAAEALQDTFISVYRKLASFDGKSKFSTWLYTIVTNNCRISRRRRKIDEILESLDDPGSTGSDVHPHPALRVDETPSDVLLTRELRGLLDTAIRRLPVDYRVVFVLRDLEGTSTEETASILGLSVEAVKSRLRRARAFLRKELRPYVSGPGRP